MPEMTMCMWRGVRNLQKLVILKQPNDDSDGEACRCYDLNYDGAMQKKNFMHAIQTT